MCRKPPGSVSSKQLLALLCTGLKLRSSMMTKMSEAVQDDKNISSASPDSPEGWELSIRESARAKIPNMFASICLWSICNLKFEEAPGSCKGAHICHTYYLNKYKSGPHCQHTQHQHQSPLGTVVHVAPSCIALKGGSGFCHRQDDCLGDIRTNMCVLP
jgi:hypothetical protein